MLKPNTLERYLDALLKGDRNLCRRVIEETLQSGVPANQVYMDVIWPIMVEIDNLYRRDVINSAQESFATRINRTLVDQLQNKLPRREAQQKKLVICCESTEQGELGGQMIADLFESNGWEVRFLGGCVKDDDVISFIQGYRPDILLMYGVDAKRAPHTRKLIDHIREVNAWPNMRIMLSGGIFDRAEGLWEEIGADLYASNPAEAVQIAGADESEIKQPERIINRRKHSTNDTKTAQKTAKASA
ncbi:methyltransferase cognate corrinoid protein, Methanosarcina family [Anaerohalosphaera lusitana]|uniref:Methyltransferase cognate corrinoid protein, Methanosarcina family n=1 Tax=Anaerohalosphaera lusitana TaxID=1936003 RepID=A0A1U9NLM4_9BACT|nr:B12-binding domain-containing protein [Anaerohalosphaera lusitana]AQT68634.1 methyltransferase cognate corrinoid protein, Methanosarcina family [Anaerohalosphaera lusitana]